MSDGRDRSRGIRQENAQLRKRVKQLENMIDWESITDEPQSIKSSLVLDSLKECPICHQNSLKIIPLGAFNLASCQSDHCEYRART